MKNKEFVVKDSGERRKFAGGAVRDRAKGKGRFDLLSPYAMKRIADIMEKGAEKYDDRNWEKGMPYSVFLDSALRHIGQYIMGQIEEDHLGMAAWNLCAIMHLEHTKPWLNDLPRYELMDIIDAEVVDAEVVDSRRVDTEDRGDMFEGEDAIKKESKEESDKEEGEESR